MSSTADTETAPEAPPVDERREAMVASLRTELGDALADSLIRPGADLWVRVETPAWADAGRAVRDVLGCNYLGFVSALDWKPSPWGRGEDDPTEPPPERSLVLPGTQTVRHRDARFHERPRASTTAGTVV